MLEGLGESQRDHACRLTTGVTAALQRFSESILEYLANLDQAPDPTVRKDAFASDIFGAYDILFHQWLQSGGAKVCSVGGDWWLHLPSPSPAWGSCHRPLGPSAIPQILVEICVHLPTPSLVLWGLPCRSSQRWAALLRSHPHLGASTH